MTKLTEYVGWSEAPTIDEEAGVVRGVKILGLESKNNRKYRKEAVANAIGMYEGLGVNLDHKDEKDRSVSEGFGRLVNVVMKDDGAYGDLEYLKAHKFAPSFVEAAKRMPEQLGLSHIAEGTTAKENGDEWVEEIAKVHWADIVRRPATTKGLFESDSPEEEEETSDAVQGEGQETKEAEAESSDTIETSTTEEQGKPEVDNRLETLQEKVERLGLRVHLFESLVGHGIDLTSLTGQQQKELQEQETEEAIDKYVEGLPKYVKGDTPKPTLPPKKKHGNYAQLREELEATFSFK